MSLERRKPLRAKPFEIPAGTPVHSMGTGRWHESKRKQTVWPFSVASYSGYTVVTWPGSGGYWRRVVLHGDAFVDYWPGHEHEPPNWEMLWGAEDDLRRNQGRA